MFKFSKNILLVISLALPQVACADLNKGAVHKRKAILLGTVATICYFQAARGLTYFLYGCMERLNYYTPYRKELTAGSGIAGLAALGCGITATIYAVKQFKKFKEESKK